ncbi:TetR/AcrR family transcriptional regulator [Streptomyces sp. NPDC020875]|uniref:TetR/AcrR family transcriptional regulator n=1 Tax=Streptomyces sp. NPDC020875 TaxID=3154898 RepID=UPI0033C99E58
MTQPAVPSTAHSDDPAPASGGREPRRKRRADAERSRAAILDAAVRLLRARPDAGLEAVARAAGLTRQTVYAHFASREALLAAVVDRITAEALAAIESAALDEGPAADALLRFLDASWRPYENYASLLHSVAATVTPASGRADRARHEPVAERLVRLVERGIRSGEFTPGLSPEWLVTTLIAVGHAAGEAAHSGRMTLQEARETLDATALRLLGARPVTNTATPA